MVSKLILKVDGYGKHSIGNVDVENINWITGSYTFISNITSVGGNEFDIIYSSDGYLYDQYTPAILGGSLASVVPSTETYACPTRASGAVTWTDVNPAGGSIGDDYVVDNDFMPTHLGRARSKTMSPYVHIIMKYLFYLHIQVMMVAVMKDITFFGHI